MYSDENDIEILFLSSGTRRVIPRPLSRSAEELESRIIGRQGEGIDGAQMAEVIYGHKSGFTGESE
jgi:hypothetical protein